MGRPTDEPFPGPWRFHGNLYEFRDVIATVTAGTSSATSRRIVGRYSSPDRRSLPRSNIATLTETSTPAHETAVNAVEPFHEGEAISHSAYRSAISCRSAR
jgi:hypothetical protein